MISKHSPTDISRSEGCTLTGVLSVTGFLEDAVTVIHGPSGCAHHNASLLHASLAEIDAADLPVLISSSLSEEEVIFGGEGALAHALDIAASLDPDLICVISTCIADTIGDDCAALCRQKREMPVVYIPGAGFLGGGFSEGIRNALMSLLPLSSGADQTDDAGVMIVGEKNLEYEAEENFYEVIRLLSLLDLNPGIRFVRRMPASDCTYLGSAPVAILREPALHQVGSAIQDRFGTSIIQGFPIGPSGSLDFIRSIGNLYGIDPVPAVREEEGVLDDLFASFCDLRGLTVRIEPAGANPASLEAAQAILQALGMKESASGMPLPLPFDPPVGTGGTKRMLHAWRRQISRA